MSEQKKLMTFWQIRQMPSASVKKARIMAAQMEITLPNVLAHAIDALEREQRFLNTVDVYCADDPTHDEIITAVTQNKK